MVRRVFVLGAGVDVACGIATVADLLPQLAKFVKDDGAEINSALRRRLGRLWFTFDRYAAGKSEALVTDLFTEAEGRGPVWRSVAVKLKKDNEMSSLGEVIEKLCDMADNNQITGDDVRALARLTGEQGEVGDVEQIIDPSKITLSHLAATGLRMAFQRALVRRQDYSEEERELLQQFIVSVSNIEELLSTYFTLFMLGRASGEQKTYLYLAWILWAFLWLKSAGHRAPEHSLYTRLPQMGGDIVTFNYTNYFADQMARRVNFFHGRLDRYLRVDDRVMVSDDRGLRGAPSPGSIVNFFENLRLDVARAPELDIPAIVPPLTFKPVMSREQLRAWAKADDVLQKADQVVVVGYSFAMSDEHFNDLLRQTRAETRILIVNPDLEKALSRAGAILGVRPESLIEREQDGFPVRGSRRLTGIAARAEDIDAELVSATLR